MKKNIYIIGLLILLNSNLFSQSNWLFREPSPTGYDLNSVFFINDSKGWIAGDYGTILKYDNSQFTQSYITSEPLKSIFFISENTGWTAGSSGKIFKTTSGGSNWFAQSTPTLNQLTSIRFATPDTGWAVGINGTILKTINGGNSWNAQFTSFSDTLKSCFCVSSMSCYAAGKNGTIMFTSNGGSNWDYQTTGINNFLNSIHFINQSTGWAAGNSGSILKTTNGGELWVNTLSPTTGNCQSVFFKSSDTGTIATGDKLYSTRDGGQNWNQYTNIPFTGHFQSVFITNSFQFSAGNSGQIARSSNEGVSWSMITNPMSPYCNNEYSGICFSNGVTGFLLQNIFGRLGCEQGNILKTTNSGVNWINQYSISNNLFVSIFSIGNNYWAACTSGGMVSNGVFISTGNEHLTSVTEVFACGSNGTILRYSGFGAATSLIYLNSNNTSTLNGIFASIYNRTIAVGANGTILRSTNIGVNWSLIPSGTNAALYSVKIDFEVGYAVGDGGTILKTTDAGESWFPLNSGVTSSLRSVVFPASNPSNVYITGTQGIILKSTNEGDTWIKEQIGNNATLTSISLRTSSAGFITGSMRGQYLLLNNTTINSNLKNLNLKILIEGLYNSISNNMVSDSVKIYLRNPAPPYSIADSSAGVISTSGEANFTFTNSANQGYYIQAKQRNSIETWSSAPVMFNASTVAYDFTSDQSRAYGNNLNLKGSKWTVFSGDVNNDGNVDATDLLKVYSDGLAGLTGYIITDLNGDNIVDLNDLLICFNNAGKFVTVIRP